MIKKILSCMLCMLMLFTCVACSNTNASASKAYVFSYNGAEIAIDDELDGVAGGYACSSGRVGDTVRVTSGETCPICGGNVGTVKAVGAMATGAVVCMNCSDSIIAYVGSATLEKI